MDLGEYDNLCPVCHDSAFDETVNGPMITCLGILKHKIHLGCINQLVASQVPNYARCLTCDSVYDIPTEHRGDVDPRVIQIMDETKAILQGHYADVKDAEKEKNYNKALWLELRGIKYTRGNKRWNEIGWAEIMKVFDKLYDKYYDIYFNVLMAWVTQHRNYDPDKIKAKGERERILSEINGVDNALIDSTNDINGLIFYINDLAFNSDENRYIQPSGNPYHYYDAPSNYFEIEHLLEPHTGVSEEMLVNIIESITNDKIKYEEDEEAKAATEQRRRTIPYKNRPPKKFVNFPYNKVNVYDDTYNRRPPPGDGSSGGYKKRNTTRKLHLFSLTASLVTPILGRFYKRKVTVPCALKMHKGVKKKRNKTRKKGKHSAT